MYTNVIRSQNKNGPTNEIRLLRHRNNYLFYFPSGGYFIERNIIYKCRITIVSNQLNCMIYFFVGFRTLYNTLLASHEKFNNILVLDFCIVFGQ